MDDVEKMQDMGSVADDYTQRQKNSGGPYMTLFVWQWSCVAAYSWRKLLGCHIKSAACICFLAGSERSAAAHHIPTNHDRPLGGAVAASYMVVSPNKGTPI